MRHNIKPELVPELVELLRTSKQTSNVLRGKEGSCYCVEGLLCELYRRHHPDTSRWAGNAFVVDKTDRGGRVIHKASDAFCPDPVIMWATTDGAYPRIVTDYEPDPIPLWRLNDGKVPKAHDVGQCEELTHHPAWSFEDFIKALQEV